MSCVFCVMKRPPPISTRTDTLFPDTTLFLSVAGIRAVLAIARHAHNDQTWIDRAQRVPAQAPAFERAGPEVLDDDVGLSDQFTQQRLTFGDTQIERHRFLVARDHRPPQRFAVFAAPPYAHRVTLARSEEHTSELQSLMRTSFAVFCLKKKKKQQETSDRK